MSETPPPTETATEQKVESKETFGWLAAIGIGALAVYIGKVLYESYKPHVPQLLWPPTQSRVEKVTVYCINFPKRQQALVTQALSSWFTSDEMEVVFESVMIIDEEDEPTSSNVANVTKGAARVAFSSIQEGKRNEEDVLVIVYRSAVSLNNDSVDIFERKHDKFLSRAAGKLFRETHCIGFTRDGKHVDILQNTVSGIVDTDLVSLEEKRMESTTKGFQVLANCVCPSKSSFAFKNKNMSSLTGSESPPSVTKDELTKLQVGDRVYRPTKVSGLLWSSPFPLFLSLGGALRYSRAEFGGTKLLLQIAKGQSGTFFGNTLDFFSRKDGSETQKLRDTFQGHFLVLFIIDNTPELSGDALSLIETGTETACETYTGNKPPSTNAPLVHTVLHEGSTTLVCLNLEGLKDCCSVLQAQKIELAVGSLLGALNLNITVVKLGVVRGPASSTILWPSENNQDGHFFSGNQYWVHPSSKDVKGMATAMLGKGEKKSVNANSEEGIYILSEIEL